MKTPDSSEQVFSLRRDKVKITKYLSLVQLVLDVAVQSRVRLRPAESIEKGIGLKRPKIGKWQGSSGLKQASDMLFHTLRLSFSEFGVDSPVWSKTTGCFQIRTCFDSGAESAGPSLGAPVWNGLPSGGSRYCFQKTIQNTVIWTHLGNKIKALRFKNGKISKNGELLKKHCVLPYMRKIVSFAPLPWRLRSKEALCTGGPSFISQLPWKLSFYLKTWKMTRKLRFKIHAFWLMHSFFYQKPRVLPWISKLGLLSAIAPGASV